MTKLYENIQFLRKEKKIRSIRELETLVGITQDTIKNYKDHLPNCEPVIKLAKFFGVSTDYLLGLTADPKLDDCKNSNLAKVFYTAKTLDLDDYASNIIIKIMHILSEVKN